MNLQQFREQAAVQERRVCCWYCHRNVASIFDVRYIHPDLTLEIKPCCWRCRSIGFSSASENRDPRAAEGWDAVDELVLAIMKRQGERCKRLFLPGAPRLREWQNGVLVDI